MILSGDAGATKTELALFSDSNGKLQKLYSERFESKDYSSLDVIIRKFLMDKETTVTSACIGIAGTVIDGIGRSTNLPWILDERLLSRELNIPCFRLANDLEIIAAAVTVLGEKDLITIYKGLGKLTEGSKAVIAPGTGLGQAALFYSGNEYNIIATEGGHSDFAVSDETEFELYKYLKNIYGHVSYERIASGMGLVNVFNFLKDSDYAKVSERILQRLSEEDEAAVISGEALNKNCKVCEKALDIFTSVLGAQAGNMVLNYKATGGVYLGGGIPLKILEKLNDSTFLRSYLSKGRLSYLTEMTPVYVIKDKSSGLLGAALMSSQYSSKGQAKVRIDLGNQNM